MADRRGFSLIEILVAFAILALSFVAISQAFSGGLRMLSASGSYAGALRVAESRLAEAGRLSPLAPGVTEGKSGIYTWRLEVAPYDGSDAGLPQAHEAVATVTWEGGGARTVSLRTIYLGAPENG